MKFLYINNQLCIRCKKCLDSCPTHAIYSSGDKLSINYDKCISCGNCFRDCLYHAISIEKIEKIAREIESLAENRSRIVQLEKDNLHLREELASVSLGLNMIVQKLPEAAIIVDSENTVFCANKNLIELLDYTVAQIAQEKPYLSGVELNLCLPGDLSDMFIGVALGDKDIHNALSVINGKNVSLSIYSIRRGELTLGIIRDLGQPEVANSETVIRIKESIDRQMAMVQKIGFLLGEEASEISKNLDSVIKIIEDV